MTLIRSALVASVATTIIWILKAVAIGVAGGAGRSPLEGPLFLLGLACAVAAAVLCGAAFARHRSMPWKVLGGVVGLAVASAFGTAEGDIVSAVQPVNPGWVWGEVNLWILMLALLAVSILLAVRRPARTPDQPVAVVVEPRKGSGVRG
jgi:hypothetical protein